MSDEITTCRRCGTCCRKGGPALHRQDLDLVLTGALPITDLITIRPGEMVDNPAASGLEPAQIELIKINGRDGQWRCRYLSEPDMSCAIYINRPLECRLLKCWDTSEIEAVMLKETLSRADVLADHPALLQIVTEYEALCPSTFLGEVISAIQEQRGRAILPQLTDMIRRDLAFRQRILAAGQIPASAEFFSLGRPLFILLRPFGVTIREQAGQILVDLAS